MPRTRPRTLHKSLISQYYIAQMFFPRLSLKLGLLLNFGDNDDRWGGVVTETLALHSFHIVHDVSIASDANALRACPLEVTKI